ncbi:hypothetical protein B5M19_01335 [Mesomycoplasma hyopneumoniae]|uniref:NERD domain-containing protein n=4 Tax=Mesomycoplasma hyopneumoniae TaxID=2099 RepID=E4QTL8_MESH1|nr:hypothetical protein [Mesomycoplasma hyopneumoniae]AAV27968.1 hypothetical protein mhp576 [Mesomycoplasma hyopneumoniae 232]ADQ90764.1 Putative uncharacterized protein [Mesomycoplasma hyopneumoniae 168]AGM22339.1 hypothetical protein MHP168L_568 [Mesomycoplasma hyopneumoniae 168-L]ASU14810.1 hypothetical protein CIB43_00927 [Mesomycoplasma hyopneumoniae]MXR12736.1 hypothetical protein [Mesomycoplasma hyopneumoniae]
MPLINIVLYSTVGLLFLILIFFIFKRLFEKTPEKISQYKLISVEQFTIDALEIINASADVKVMTNLLLKNRFSKLNYSVLPGLIVNESNLFFVSNIINYQVGIDKIIIDENIIFLKKGKILKQNYFSKSQFDSLFKLLDKKFSNSKIVILVDDRIDFNQIDNKTRFEIWSQNDIIKKLRQNSQKIYIPKKIIDYFSSINQFNKEKNA